MLPADPVLPPEWLAVRDALKAGYRPPRGEPVPPPPIPRPGKSPLEEAWLKVDDQELEAVRRCIGGPIKGYDDPKEGT